MPHERGFVGQAARDIGREVVAEVGADIIRGRTGQGAAATPGWWNSWWKSFLAVWWPGMSSATLAAVKGRVVDTLKRDPSIAADEVMDKAAEFDRFLVRLREREPWRVQRFAEVIAEIPDSTDQEKAFLGAFDAEPRDWEARIASIAAEKPLSTRAGEWFGQNVFNWEAAKRHLNSGWQFTKRHARRGDTHATTRIAPAVRAKRIAWNASLDRAATRVEQRGGKLTTKWWLPL